MQTYLALLRGINVGGNSLVKMAELKVALERCGFADVHTYIQSGNVIFRAASSDKAALEHEIEQCILREFHVTTRAVVFTRVEWHRIIQSAPSWWGKDPAWKHNLLVVIPPYDMAKIVTAVGVLKPDIEAMTPGEGVLYQSISKALFGRTTTGKLASNPVYKSFTIRNYNTAQKLLALF